MWNRIRRKISGKNGSAADSNNACLPSTGKRVRKASDGGKSKKRTKGGKKGLLTLDEHDENEDGEKFAEGAGYDEAVPENGEEIEDDGVENHLVKIEETDD